MPKPTNRNRSSGQTKTLYHSELVKSGTVEAQIMSEPTESKYEGKPPYVTMKIDGVERIYNCENDECERALEGLRGKTVQLTAEGSREEATLHVLEEDGAPVSRHQERQTPRSNGHERRESAPPRDGGETKEEKKAREFAAFSKAKVYAGRVKVLWEICGKHADLLMTAAYGDVVGQMTEYEQCDLHMRMTNSLFIETKSVTDIRELPVVWYDTHKPVDKATEAPRPKPAPPAPAPVDDDEIPF